MISALADTKLIIVVVTALLLLVICLTLGECQRIYASNAKRNLPSDHVVKYKKGTGAMRFSLALLSPASLVLILMFIITALVQI